MKIPTRTYVPADDVRPGDQLELRDETGVQRATVKTATALGKDRFLYGTSIGPVQVPRNANVHVMRTVEVA